MHSRQLPGGYNHKLYSNSVHLRDSLELTRGSFNSLEVHMDKWKCSVCGYVYDPQVGNPDGGIPPNTPFENLPDDWVCPVCGASKDEFEKVVE